jgi:hypothetical protein
LRCRKFAASHTDHSWHISKKIETFSLPKTNLLALLKYLEMGYGLLPVSGAFQGPARYDFQDTAYMPNVLSSIIINCLVLKVLIRQIHTYVIDWFSKIHHF